MGVMGKAGVLGKDRGGPDVLWARSVMDKYKGGQGMKWVYGKG
jgi:hypothetical protein